MMRFYNSVQPVMVAIKEIRQRTSAFCVVCVIIILRPGLGERRRILRGSTRGGRDALIETVGRAREKGEAHWPVMRGRPVVREPERPVMD